MMTIDLDTKWGKVGLFALGAVAGVVGLKLIQSKPCREALVSTAATALRLKAGAVESGTKIQESVEDILAEAEELNSKKDAEEAAAAAAKKDIEAGVAAPAL